MMNRLIQNGWALMFGMTLRQFVPIYMKEVGGQSMCGCGADQNGIELSYSANTR